MSSESDVSVEFGVDSIDILKALYQYGVKHENGERGLIMRVPSWFVRKDPRDCVDHALEFYRRETASEDTDTGRLRLFSTITPGMSYDGAYEMMKRVSEDLLAGNIPIKVA